MIYTFYNICNVNHAKKAPINASTISVISILNIMNEEEKNKIIDALIELYLNVKVRSTEEVYITR